MVPWDLLNVVHIKWKVTVKCTGGRVKVRENLPWSQVFRWFQVLRNLILYHSTMAANVSLGCNSYKMYIYTLWCSFIDKIIHHSRTYLLHDDSSDQSHSFRGTPVFSIWTHGRALQLVHGPISFLRKWQRSFHTYITFNTEHWWCSALLFLFNKAADTSNVFK